MIAILCHSIGPYHATRYKQLSLFTKDAIVIELSSSQGKNPWINMGHQVQLPVVTLFEQPWETLSKSDQKLKMENSLNQINPDVVVSVGYSEPAMRLATIWARQNQALSIMITDTWKGDRRRYFLKEWIKGYWCRKNYDALIVSGIRSYEYFSALGFPVDRIWRGVDVVDNNFFVNEVIDKSEIENIKQKSRLPQLYFLCCARMSPEKNIEGLINAFSLYVELNGPWDLVLVGTATLEKHLRALINEPAKGRIHFMGWVQYPELPIYYRLASCFILPSLSEPWGLVVNEAMACGLPVLVSRKCGCMPELCWRGINGFDFDPYDTEELAKLMLRVSSGEVDLTTMGDASRQIVANFSPENWARSLLDCVNTLRNQRK